MSGHIWDVMRFTNETVASAREALCLIANSGEPVATWIPFVGYAQETTRQKGGIAAWTILRGAIKSKHRYARGRNAANYLVAGRMLIARLAPEVGLTGEAPAEAVIDKLQEEGWLSPRLSIGDVVVYNEVQYVIEKDYGNQVFLIGNTDAFVDVVSAAQLTPVYGARHQSHYLSQETLPTPN